MGRSQRQFVFVLILAVALAVLLPGVVATGVAEPPADGGAAAPTTTPAGAVAGPDSVARTSGPALERATVADAGHLTGRCVDADSGDPLSGCVVTVVGGASTRTRADGRWQLPCPPEAWATLVRIEADGRLGVERRFGVDERRAGDVSLRRAGRVSGQLLDEHDRPFAGAVVRLESVAAPGRDDGWLERRDAASAVAVDGTFGCDRWLPLGPMRASVDGAPPLLGETQFVVTARTFVSLRCRACEPSEMIAGRVVGADGASVSGALVQAVDRLGGRARCVATTRTDDRGAFRLVASPRETEACTLVATVVGEQGAREGRLAEVAWGASDVEVSLTAGDAVALHVHDARTGAPIERYAVQCVRVSGVRSGQDGALRLAGEHRDGRVVLNVRRGPARIVVVPDDPRCMPASIDVVGDDDMRPLEVRVERMRPMQVDVRDERGAPVAGVDVAVVAPGNHRDPDVIDDARAARMRALSSDPRRTFATIVYRARTDPGGRCIVFGPPEEEALRLLLSRGRGRVRKVDGVAVRDGVREVVW
ncbi:MAG: carboxypeptidase regulatory-like domain-containing protein [Planctomycetes bacterium]|nr:carboxypeptidase regulatory-like domain-containing protein [Planctomycetota bacterium]